jgi:cell division inhibitor SulA
MHILRKSPAVGTDSAGHTDKFSKNRMNEMIIPQTHNSNHILFSLVASLSQKKEKKSSPALPKGSRWVTWITDRKPSRHQLDSYGSDNSTIRIIHTRTEDDNRWLIWEALSKGNSRMVIADVTDVTTDDIAQFESAAQQGQCVGILARSTNTLAQLSLYCRSSES